MLISSKNKITNQFGSFIEPLMIITAFLIGMFSEGQVILTLKWLALSLLWCLSLWYLRKSNCYYSIIKDPAFTGYLVFIAWAIFSSLFLSSAKSISIIMLIPFIGGLLSYLIAFMGSNKKDQYIDWLLVGIGLTLVIYTGYQKLILGIDRPTGFLGNWNSHAAVLAIIILPWILRNAIKPSIPLSQLVYVSIFSFLFSFAMGLTLSRGVLLIIGTGIFCLLCLSWCQQIFKKQSLIFFIALFAGYLTSSLFGVESIVSRLQDASQADSLAALGSGRHLLWLPAWEMYLDRPLSGWGLGNFRFLYMQYKPPLSEELGHFAHNDYLQFLVELGPIGLVLFLGFVCILFKRLYNLIATPWPSLSKPKIESFALLSTCIGLLIHTFFTFHLYHISLQIIFGYYLGRATRHLYIEQNTLSHTITQKQEQKYLWFFRGGASLVILLIICFGFSFYFLEKAELEPNEQKQLDYFWQAGLFFPALERYDSFSAFVLSKHLKKLDLEQESPRQHEKMATLALTEVNTAIDKMPYNTINYVTKANIMQTLGYSIPVVSEQYENALQNEPYVLSIRHQYAQYLVNRQQNNKALAVLWGAWNRLNVSVYQIGINYLAYHLEINKLYGEQKDSVIIEQEIQRLTKLKKTKKGGEFVFKKS